MTDGMPAVPDPIISARDLAKVFRTPTRRVLGQYQSSGS